MTVAQLQAILPADERSKGMLAALAGSMLMSFDPVFIRLSGTGGFNTVFLFGLFTAISMFTFIQTTDPRGLVGALRESGWPAVFSGLLILGSASCFVLSVKHTAVANTMIIISGRPVLTAATAWLFLREETPKALWLAMLAVIAGIAVVVSGSLRSGMLLGDLFALGAVLCLALNGALLRRFKRVSRMAIVGLAGLFMAIVMYAPATPGSFSLNTWLVMAAMGLASAPFGRVLNGVSTRYIRAAESALIALSNTVFAPFWIFVLFGEQPPLRTIVGGSIILCAIAAYVLLAGKKTSQRVSA